MRRSMGRSQAAFGPALALALTLNGTQLVMAQGGAPPTATAPPALPAAGGAKPPAAPSGAPLPLGPGSAATLPAPTATVTPPAAPAGPSGRVLSLDDVVKLAVNDNSSILLARQRLQKAEYQIAATNAQARPQITAAILDTYSSQKTFGTSGGANTSNPTLPGGGAIPTVTDQGGGTTSTFVGGGGGGTAASTGTAATTGTTSAPATASGTTLSTGSGTTGTGTTGATGTTGTGVGTGTGSTGTGAATGLAVPMASLPPIAQRYAAAVMTPGGGAVGRTVPRASGTTGGSGGTGTTGTSAPGNTVGTGAQNTGGNGTHNNYSGRATITQYIDIFGLVPAALDVEKMTREFYQIDLQRIENETALAAKDDFFTVLRDQAQVGVDQEQITAAAANLHITQVRYIAGAAAEADVLTAEVTLSNDQQTQTTDQNALNLGLANLLNLLGMSPDDAITLQPPPLPPFNAVIDLQQSTQIALKQRPELRQAANNIVIANKLVRLAGASLLPTLGVSGTASYSGLVSPGTPHDGYTVTAQLNIPLYDGGYAHAQVNSARVDLQTQIITRHQLEQNVILEVRQAYLNIGNDQARAASAAVGAANAREAARIAALQFQYGTNTYQNVLTADAQLAVAETNALNAEFSYQTDLATLVRAIGGR